MSKQVCGSSSIPSSIMHKTQYFLPTALLAEMNLTTTLDNMATRNH